jgi:GNAT superfamily N-acetyltransferase
VRGEMPLVLQLEIRRAGPEDAAVVARVLQESFAEFKPLYSDGGFGATTPRAEQVLARMREGPVWLALHEGVALGTVAIVVRGASAYIRGMAVLPAARGSGTGSALLQHAENWAVKAGCARLFLSTTPFLGAAIRLYERFGFHFTDDETRELFGTPLLTMEKNISSLG